MFCLFFSLGKTVIFSERGRKRDRAKLYKSLYVLYTIHPRCLHPRVVVPINTRFVNSTVVLTVP